MKKKLIGIFICMLLIFTVLPVSANILVDKINNSTMIGNTLYVGGSGPNNYTKIQDAIDNASDGDTVFVYNGTYHLNYTITIIIINISIRLIGENKFNTILYGGSIEINASKVEIRDFTFQNSIAIMTMPFFEEVTISNNIFKIEEFTSGVGGIGIFSNYSNISDNSFFNCSPWITSSNHNSVYNNTVNGKPLVYFGGASDKVIDYAGQVILIDCNDITIKNLELSNTFSGIELFDTVNCLISNNKLSNNAIAGLFFNSSNNIISGNIFSNNVLGLVFGECEGNNISKNSFENNGFSLFFMISSSNLISYNNFKYDYKSHNRNILSTKSHNTWMGNFWNRFRLLPVLIWNFKTTQFRFLPFLPTSPDVDWSPAKEPNDINGVKSHLSILERTIPSNRRISNYLTTRFIEQFPLLKRLLNL